MINWSNFLQSFHYNVAYIKGFCLGGTNCDRLYISWWIHQVFIHVYFYWKFGYRKLSKAPDKLLWGQPQRISTVIKEYGRLWNFSNKSKWIIFVNFSSVSLLVLQWGCMWLLSWVLCSLCHFVHLVCELLEKVFPQVSELLCSGSRRVAVLF